MPNIQDHNIKYEKNKKFINIDSVKLLSENKKIFFRMYS